MADSDPPGQELTVVHRVDPRPSCTALQLHTQYGLSKPPTDRIARGTWLQQVCDLNLPSEQQMVLLSDANAIVVKPTGGVEATHKKQRQRKKTDVGKDPEEDGLGKRGEPTLFGDGKLPVPTKVQMDLLALQVRKIGSVCSLPLRMLFSPHDDVHEAYIAFLKREDKTILFNTLWPDGEDSIYTHVPEIHDTFMKNDEQTRTALTTLFKVDTDEGVQQIRQYICNRIEQDRGGEDLAFTGMDVGVPTQRKTMAWSDTEFNLEKAALEQVQHHDDDGGDRVTTRTLAGKVSATNPWRDVSNGQEVVINSIFPKPMWHELGVLFDIQVDPDHVFLHIQLMVDWTGDDDEGLTQLVYMHRRRYWLTTSLDLQKQIFMEEDEAKKQMLMTEFATWSQHEPMVRVAKDNDGKEHKFLVLCIAHTDVEPIHIQLDDDGCVSGDWEAACYNEYQNDTYYSVQVTEDSRFTLCFKMSDDGSEVEDDDQSVTKSDCEQESEKRVQPVSRQKNGPLRLELGVRQTETEYLELVRAGDTHAVDSNSDGETSLNSECSDDEEDPKKKRRLANAASELDIDIPSYPAENEHDRASIERYYTREATSTIQSMLHGATHKLTSAIDNLEDVVELAGLIPGEYNKMAQSVFQKFEQKRAAEVKRRQNRPTMKRVGASVRHNLPGKRRVDEISASVGPDDGVSRGEGPSDKSVTTPSLSFCKKVLKRKREGGGHQ